MILFWTNLSSSSIEQITPEFIEHFKQAEAFLKPYSKEYLPEADVRRLINQVSIETFPRPIGIPETFKVKISQKGGGMLYIHSENPNISIRVMPGKPHSPNPCQQKPYIVQIKGDKAVDKFGNFVPTNALVYLDMR